jgi:hypothetical protein
MVRKRQTTTGGVTVSNRNIERYRALISRNLMRIDGTLEYPRITQAFIQLGNYIADAETDESTWYLGEFDYSLDSIIVGAFWHYDEWHGGQSSDGYAALSALGRVFDPGMTSGPEPDSGEYDIYAQLNIEAESWFNGSRKAL